MSQNHGLDKNLPSKKRSVTVPYTQLVRTGVIPVPPKVEQEAKRMTQTELTDYRYNPLSRGRGVKSNYKRVSAPVRERCLKKDPLQPAVSFIPRAVLLEEQPAIQNPAAPDYYALRPEPMNEIPDQTVCNNPYETRDLFSTNKNLKNMLQTRQTDINLRKMQMRKLQPNAPEIVDVKVHEHLFDNYGIRNPKLRSKNLRSRKAGKTMSGLMMMRETVMDKDKHRAQHEAETKARMENRMNPDTLLDSIRFTASFPPYQK
jgi:hypothetical protein